MRLALARLASVSIKCCGFFLHFLAHLKTLSPRFHLDRMYDSFNETQIRQSSCKEYVTTAFTAVVAWSSHLGFCGQGLLGSPDFLIWKSYFPVQMHCATMSVCYHVHSENTSVNVCTKLQGNPFNSCEDLLIKLQT